MGNASLRFHTTPLQAACAGIIWAVCVAVPMCVAAAEESVVVETVHGTTTAGALEKMTPTHVTVAGETRETFPMTDVIRIDWPSRHSASLGEWDLVLLANGDRIVATPVKTEEDVLRANWQQFPGLKLLSIPLEMVQGVAWKLPQDRNARSGVVTRLVDHAARSDLLTLNNGNSVAGELLEFDTTSLKLETATGPLDIERDSLRSLAFNPALIAFPKSDGLRLIVSLIDGSRFTATDFQLRTDAGMEFATAFGGQVTFALDRIVSMQVVGGRAVYLSDLKPQAYTFTPYLSLRWPLRQDRNVTGESLRLGGREYAKGLGTHSRCEVSYALDGQYTRFTATVGIDDDAGPDGNALAEVLVDDKLVWSSTPLSVGNPPQRIPPIDVSGGQTLTLRVQFAQRGDVQDHVDWCDPVLVKKP